MPEVGQQLSYSGDFDAPRRTDGVLGSLVVVSTLIGIFIGRWLDRAVESGIFWTVSLLFAGVCLGCWLAWKRVNQA